MNKKNEIYKNNKYIEALKELVKNSDYSLSMFSEEPEEYFGEYTDFIKSELEDDPDNVNYQNKLKFCDNAYLIMASGEFCILNYYSKKLNNYYFFVWDSEGVCYHLEGDYVNFIDNTFIKENIIKPDRLNFIRRCQAIGLVYKPIDSAQQNETKNELYKDVYIAAVLQY